DLAIAQTLGEKLSDFLLAAAEAGGWGGPIRLGRRGQGLVGTRGVKAPHSQTGELAAATLAELEARADNEVLDGARDEHIARLGRRHDARRDVQRHAAGLPSCDLALAGVHSRADAQAQIEQFVADLERAVDGPSGPVENCGDALLAGLDLSARLLQRRFASLRG